MRAIDNGTLAKQETMVRRVLISGQTVKSILRGGSRSFGRSCGERKLRLLRCVLNAKQALSRIN